MTILSDRDIREEIRSGQISIDPMPTPDRFQPASIDLTLDTWFAVPTTSHRYTPPDPVESIYRISQGDPVFPNIVRPYHMGETNEKFWSRFPINGFVLIRPGEFMLASTTETVRLSKHVVGRVEGKSTPARWGLIVHTTAGFIDPGFDGPITLELVNVGPFAYALHPGDPICQLSIEWLSSAPTRAYNGHYQHQGRPGLPV